MPYVRFHFLFGLLSVFALPLLACAVFQPRSAISTPSQHVPVSTLAVTSSRTPTRISPNQTRRQTALFLTRSARQTLAVPTSMPTPTLNLALPSNTAAPTRTPRETATPTPTFPLDFFFPRVIYATIPAPSLTNNLLGEGSQREVLVYLPASYYRSTKRYPTVYYLMDFGAQGVPGGIRPEDIEKDVRVGYTKEMIIIVVSGVNSLGGSFYVNSPITGNWDDFVAHDVVAYVDDRYRTLPDAASRGLSGDSMGGFGALSVSMRHPDVFNLVYSIRPYLFDADGLVESPMFAASRTINAFVDLQTRELTMPVDDALSEMQHTTGEVQFTLAYGAAFVPNPQAGPPYLDYPYYRQNGRLFRNEIIWGRWNAGFGALRDKIVFYRENLLKLKSLIIDCGEKDSYRWIPRGCNHFSEQLTKEEIPHKLVIFAGDEKSSLAQRIREELLPFFSENFVFDD